MDRLSGLSHGLGQVLIGLLLLFAWAAPVILAKLFADTLDRAPYLISLSAGVGAAIVLGLMRWPSMRGALTGIGAARSGTTAWLLLIAFCPTWAIGIGLGANRAFDRSPAVQRQCRVLKWQRPAKGPARCLVTSWRGRPAETLTDTLLQGGTASGEDGRANEVGCAPGQALVVSTRAGGLGWEWIAGVRPR
jgi:hypothetical protein